MRSLCASRSWMRFIGFNTGALLLCEPTDKEAGVTFTDVFLTFHSLGQLQPPRYKTRTTLLRGLVHLALQLCSGASLLPVGKQRN